MFLGAQCFLNMKKLHIMPKPACSSQENLIYIKRNYFDCISEFLFKYKKRPKQYAKKRLIIKTNNYKLKNLKTDNSK